MSDTRDGDDLPPLVPEAVRVAIALDLTEGVSKAAAHFDHNAADEDSLTGALIDRLADIAGQVGEWAWSVRPVRTSSTLVGGGEDALGADFVFQVDVYQDGINTAQKLVPIQSKKLWSGADKLLAKQAHALTEFPGSGIVTDYRPGSYLAVTADVAWRASGDRRRIDAAKFRDLGSMLGEDFLQCRVGTRSCYLNSEGTELVFSDGRRVRVRTPYAARLRVARTRSKPLRSSR